MLAITYKNHGGPEVLTLTEVAQPKPRPEQFLVKVHAAGVNRADTLQRRGKYPPPEGESEILGLEISGEIVEIGEADPHFKVGDRVFGLVASGAYAEYCCIDKGLAIHIPEELNFIEAAGIAEAFLTAQEALLSLGDLQPYESCLIHAGASGVGSAAIQIARQFAATIFTSVSTDRKAERVKTFGADHVINYKEKNLADEILELTHNQGVDLILDFLGGSYLNTHLQLLKPEGRLICVGLMGGTTGEINLSQLLAKRLHMQGVTMRSQPIDAKRFFTERFKRHLLPLFAQRKLFPVIDRVFPARDAKLAHEFMENNQNIGKIILQFVE